MWFQKKQWRDYNQRQAAHKQYFTYINLQSRKRLDSLLNSLKV